ncbi:MAG: hypothetical protein ACI4JN_06480 [Ruminococcus sp.]
MLESEFERLTDKPFTPEEFEKIHYVYCYYPGVKTHADIALIWAIGGIRLIEDMMPTAQKIADAEQEMRKARRFYEAARERYREVYDVKLSEISLCEREIQELKRLLKLAVEDFERFRCLMSSKVNEDFCETALEYHCNPYDLCNSCPLSGSAKCKWKHADEAMKLIGGEENT